MRSTFYVTSMLAVINACIPGRDIRVWPSSYPPSSKQQTKQYLSPSSSTSVAFTSSALSCTGSLPLGPKAGISTPDSLSLFHCNGFSAIVWRPAFCQNAGTSALFSWCMIAVGIFQPYSFFSRVGRMMSTRLRHLISSIIGFLHSSIIICGGLGYLLSPLSGSMWW